MDWLADLVFQESVAHSIAVLSLAIFPGIILGNRSIFGIKIGIAGVLFSSLAIGALSLPLDAHILHFVREFGLILFVFAVGLQVGPGFFSNFRDQGVRLNLYAVGIVASGVGLAVAIQKGFHIPVEAMVGILSGAVTNTPGLGAAQQALKDVPGLTEAALSVTGTGYAVAYPFGIFGIILSMVLVRKLHGIVIKEEAERFDLERGAQADSPQTFSIQITNPLLMGKPFNALAQLVGIPMVLSRLYRDNRVIIPRDSDRVEAGDLLQLVCRAQDLERITALIGPLAQTDLRLIPGDLSVRKILVSRKGGAGLRFDQLRLQERLGVRVTRVLRSGIEFVPDPKTSLHIGDRITVVGSAEGLGLAAEELGDSRASLERPNLLPVFLGIVIGVAVGSIPLSLPGLPAPVKLGMAGGPLLIALLMGFKRKVGPIHFFMPGSSNQFMREMGILLFLAAVGLLSGETFFESLWSGQGWYWMLAGAAITFLPIFLAAMIARWRKMNYLTLSGLLAGSMTDPPALGYANSLHASQAQSVAYATVYPFTMFLRVIAAQIFVMVLTGSR